MSSPFKTVVQNDIKNCFFNVSEFADKLLVNDKSMPAMLDDNEASDREIKYIGYGNNGMYKQKKLLYVAASDYGNMPAAGNALKLDGQMYRIFDVSSEGGIYAITLEAWDNGSNRGRR